MKLSDQLIGIKMDGFRLMTEVQVAEALNISVSKLRKERLEKSGMPYYKIGACVRYSPIDIKKYLKSKLGH